MRHLGVGKWAWHRFGKNESEKHTDLGLEGKAGGGGGRAVGKSRLSEVRVRCGTGLLPSVSPGGQGLCLVRCCLPAPRTVPSAQQVPWRYFLDDYWESTSWWTSCSPRGSDRESSRIQRYRNPRGSTGIQQTRLAPHTERRKGEN